MPRTTVLFFAESGGRAPALDFLLELRKRNRRAFLKCVVRVERLAELGHELRRPEADVLRDGIYELRVRHGTINYRLLYFFAGKAIAVIGHAITKEDAVPGREIDRAVRRKNEFLADPARHTYSGTVLGADHGESEEQPDQ